MRLGFSITYNIFSINLFLKKVVIPCVCVCVCARVYIYIGFIFFFVISSSCYCNVWFFFLRCFIFRNFVVTFYLCVSDYGKSVFDET